MYELYIRENHVQTQCFTSMDPSSEFNSLSILKWLYLASSCCSKNAIVIGIWSFAGQMVVLNSVGFIWGKHTQVCTLLSVGPY